MQSTNVNLTSTRTIITYDLENNDISAKEIAEASKGVFDTLILMNDGKVFNLPNTTLHTTLYTKDIAIQQFRIAFSLAKNKKIFSKAKIKNIFACDVFGKNGFIENN